MTSASASPVSQTKDYLLNMIAELAKLARENGETPFAIHLEAIVQAEFVRQGRPRPH